MHISEMSDLGKSVEAEKEFFSRIQNTQNCWDRFFLQGKDPEQGEIDPMILDAWKECRAYKLDPYEIRRDSVSTEEYQERQRKMEMLIEATRPIFDTFMKESAGIVHTLDLYDADLVFIHTFGGASATSESRYASPGVRCNPEKAGVTAMSLVKRSGRPQRLVGAEHFDAKLHDRICTAVPIYDKKKELLGVINVVERLRLDSLRTLGILSAIAQGISFNIENMRQKETIKRNSALNQEILETVSSGIMVVDSGGKVLAVNRAALNFLGVRERDRFTGHNLEELFGEDNILSTCLSDGRSLYDTNFTLNMEGQEYHLTGSIRKMKYQKAADSGLIIVFHDMPAMQGFLKEVAGWQANMTFDNILGSSLPMRRVRRIAEKAAGLSSTILIQGESGTGKEIFAQAVHNGSKFRRGPFISINCAAIPHSLIESELFGYESGAFTGARKGGQPGKFELAQNGTIFLDEINSMPLDMQTKLLRVLQERVVTRIGGSGRLPLNIRVIAACNENLLNAVQEGRFRLDLYYRLNVVLIEIPPLRARTEDIPELCATFLADRDIGIDPDAVDYLRTYSWPGNVRELENTLERAEVLVRMSGQTRIGQAVIRRCIGRQESGGEAFWKADPDFPDPENVQEGLSGQAEDIIAENSSLGNGEGLSLAGTGESAPSASVQASPADRKKAEELLAALERFHWNIARVAKELGITRNTVYNRIKKYGLEQ